MDPNRRFLFGQFAPASQALTAAQVADICRTAQSKRTAIANYPLDKVLSVLDEVRALWAAPEYPLRKKALELLPEATGFSRPMIDLAFGEMRYVLTPAVLQKKVATELRGHPRRGDHVYVPETCTSLYWEPLGVLLHVLAGNVFSGAVSSLAEGLITGNVNILKMSSAETIFLPLLMESLLECDRDGVVSASLAVIEYSSAQADVITELKRSVDGIVVWGGEQAVREYRNDLPARTRAIVFGPKLSVAMVTPKGVMADSVAIVAEQLAHDLSVWDQYACTAPQACYVEGSEAAKELARALAQALPALCRTLPAGPIEPDAAVEIQKVRGVAEIAEGRGQGLCLASNGSVDWTVTVEHADALEPSPLHRTLRIVPVDTIDTALTQLEQMRGYIQTVGLCAGLHEQQQITAKLLSAGVLRVVDIGKMDAGLSDDPHDGAYDLPQLMNVAMHRTTSLPDGMDPLELMPAETRKVLCDSRLRTLLAAARQTRFYANRLQDVTIDSVQDLAKIPPLTRKEMEANMPPAGDGLCPPEDYWGGYVTRSGGSTGEPKYSIFDGPDWERLVGHGARVFRALGIKRGDRLANCMLAGDLYGSFVSFDHVHCRVGATTFAFAGAAATESFVDTWRKFRFNVIVGMPSSIVPLLRRAKELEPSLRLETVVYAGAPMTATDRCWLKSAVSVRRIASVIGANDGGPLGYQCEHMEGPRHHLIDDYNYVEIADATGRPLPDGETGRILVTSLQKHTFPLIRYEIGDEGRIVPGPCPCGRTTRVMDLLGRADDIVVVGTVNLDYRDIRAALADLEVSQVQLVVRSSADGDYLVVRVETPHPAPDFVSRVDAALHTGVPALAEHVKKHAIARLELEVMAANCLPRNPRTGKVKSILDER